MFKVFNLILTVCFIAFQSVAFAANPAQVDWNSAPRFTSKKDFANYLRECDKNLKTVIPVIFSGLNFTNEELTGQDLFKIAPIWAGVFNVVKRDGQDIYALGEITNTPGARVAYAYQHGDTSFLTADEMQLYNEAVPIVKEALQRPTALQQELFIHDTITGRVTFYAEGDVPFGARFSSAIGALLDGRANCQGYTDAFIMLARMCGFDVSRMEGKAGGGGHTWATIKFGNKSYFVDLTWDDASFTNSDSEYTNYIYFNVPVEIAKETHSWEPDIEPYNLQRTPDGAYFYKTTEYKTTHGQLFGIDAASAEAALREMARNATVNGWRFSYAMCPYNERYFDASVSNAHLLNDILPQEGWNVFMNITRRGKYMFYAIDATK